MSEYMEKHSVSRMIGAPPGYVGYEGGGQLTEAVRRRPYSLVLLDEVEKAHPDVLNVLLQILDEGQVTDGQGNKVDFKNTIVIMTSNIGADLMLKGLTPEIRQAVMKRMRTHFRPELLNRIGEIIMFNPLTEITLRKIIQNMIELINKRLEDRQIDIVIDDNACDYIVNEAYVPEFGARPLHRYIEKNIVTHVSKMLFTDDLVPTSTIHVRMTEEEEDEEEDFEDIDQGITGDGPDISRWSKPTLKRRLSFRVQSGGHAEKMRRMEID